MVGWAAAWWADNHHLQISLGSHNSHEDIQCPHRRHEVPERKSDPAYVDSIGEPGELKAAHDKLAGADIIPDWGLIGDQSFNKCTDDENPNRVTEIFCGSIGTDR